MNAGDARQSRIQSWLEASRPWHRAALAMAAGALAVLAHAPFQFAPAFVAAIVALVWLLDAAARRKRPIMAAFAAGWFFGAGYFLVGMSWVSSAFLVDSDTWGPLWGVPAAVAMAAGGTGRANRGRIIGIRRDDDILPSPWLHILDPLAERFHP